MADYTSDVFDHELDRLADGNTDIREDDLISSLLEVGFFDRDTTPDERHDAREYLESYLWDEYGIDFDIEFDWLGYREWYDSDA